jgi:hypothetical protein
MNLGAAFVSSRARLVGVANAGRRAANVPARPRNRAPAYSGLPWGVRDQDGRTVRVRPVVRDHRPLHRSARASAHLRTARRIAQLGMASTHASLRAVRIVGKGPPRVAVPSMGAMPTSAVPSVPRPPVAIVSAETANPAFQ